MPTLIVQKGHCYRTSGATGTGGEQSYATAVADACVRLLAGRNGWTVRPTLADVNDYRADAFVAIHCDGSTNPNARGASVGYRTPEGQQFAHAWQRAYAARGWPSFRPDNYTEALASYYGVRNAVAAGTRRAFIAECGFLTSPVDRDLLLAAGGPERVALAIGDALNITTEEDVTPEQHAMLKFVNDRVAGIMPQRYWVPDPDDTTGLKIIEVPANHPGARPATLLDTLAGNYLVHQLRPLADDEAKILDAVAEAQENAGAAAQAATEASIAATKAEIAATHVLAKVEEIAVGGVDLDALAKKVADLLDQRARDDDPSTGPRT